MQNNLSIFNFRIWFKRLVSILLLVVSIIFIFNKFIGIVKVPRSQLYDFYHYVDENTIDVLCVGSSHMYCGINPVQMWDDYGIAAFDLACGAQSVWFSYYYIKEALKTQKPKVIILDVYTLKQEKDKYFDEKVESNLLNMSLSYNKWEALQATGVDNKVELFFQFPILHSRYDELESRDFDLDNNGNVNYLGYYYETRIVPYEEAAVADVSGVTECEPITQKTEEYLRKSIELCQEENVDIILVNAPWPDITDEVQKKYNYIQKIAEEYEVPFLNGCLYNNEIGMDYTVDSMGDGGHLNYTGVTKYTEWLCKWLNERYDLPDRRGNEYWSAWQRQSDKLKAKMLKNELGSIDDINEYLDAIREKENMYYIISLNGDYRKEGAYVLDALEADGFNIDFNGTYVMNAQEQLFYSGGEKEYNWWHYFGDSVLNVYEDENGGQEVRWNKGGYSIVENGVNILVYDELLGEVVGKIGFDADNDYTLVRWN